MAEHAAADIEPVPDPLDGGSEDHPQNDQVTCSAQHPDHGLIWRCALPLLHAGDHASGPLRWRKR